MKKRGKLVLDKTIKYKQPCIITLSGLPGSGKTTCAKILSKNLKVFIVSNDFFRERYEMDKLRSDTLQRILNKKILLLNLKRLIQLFSSRVSIVLDSDVNNIDKFKKVELLTKIFRYEIIKIKVNSTDDKENIKRIKKRVENNDVLDSEIIGDNFKPICLDKEIYYRVKSRKPQLLEEDFFDYVLDNNGNLANYLNDLDELVIDIQKKLV